MNVIDQTQINDAFLISVKIIKETLLHDKPFSRRERLAYDVMLATAGLVDFGKDEGQKTPAGA